MNKFVMILLFSMMVLVLSKPSPDFDYDDDFDLDDDDDDDDDRFFRFRSNNNFRRNTNSFHPSFRFNNGRSSFNNGRSSFNNGRSSFLNQQSSFNNFRTSFRPQPIGFHSQQQVTPFRPVLRECGPSSDNNSSPPPVLTVVRFTPFVLIRHRVDEEPQLILYDSQHVAILSRQCSTSEILDLATKMISSTTSKFATELGHPQHHTLETGVVMGEKEEEEEEDSYNDLEKALIPSKTYKKVKKLKTIQDFNPNPNLLSKKAIQTRKMKFTEQKQISKIDLKEKLKQMKTENESPGNDLHNFIKTTKHFETSPLNEIRKPPQKISKPNQSSRALGSRQMRVTNKLLDLEDSDYMKEEIDHLKTYQNERTYLKTNRIIDAFNEIERPVTRKPNAERNLGNRQVDLLKLFPKIGAAAKRTSLKKKKSHKKHKGKKKGRVRKVLKGRRKISSSELRKDAFNLFI